MSETNKPEHPFDPLGRKLKQMRVSRQETLAEVSGAVEIDISQLEIIEQGKSRPSEDILLLLMNHFETKDEDASRLWKLAGYVPQDSGSNETDAKQIIAVTPEDLKIVYTDMVHVTVNNFGVIMNFMQGGGSNNQPLAIARVGMSKEHAQSVLELLQKTLAAQKQLPAPRQSQDSN